MLPRHRQPLFAGGDTEVLVPAQTYVLDARHYAERNQVCVEFVVDHEEVVNFVGRVDPPTAAARIGDRDNCRAVGVVRRGLDLDPQNPLAVLNQQVIPAGFERPTHSVAAEGEPGSCQDAAGIAKVVQARGGAPARFARLGLRVEMRNSEV